MPYIRRKIPPGHIPMKQWFVPLATAVLRMYQIGSFFQREVMNHGGILTG
jgi:hypothetical protein